MSTPDPFREWDGAYVLGSLSTAERLAYEEHLAQCASCEREVCGLAGLTGLLSRVPEAWAVQSLGTDPEVPAAVLPRLVRAVRRRQLVVMAATVLVAAMTGAVLGVLIWCYP
ncbi:zf-HC2 domain-containing protein [Lentzea sp. BCCO 10_0798]|uniref:Zf-HC2 domain-containing protein n=1 Tax=Lentzea kristufekii TaxID=3095430 RepID=A0ABU4TU27_9PSEU|nr:zf-HC2 domain-containing protein [Lentzea sp. BCCO 10_0798]MDX8051800.1 zf-HC2 domain-containing protein [Lentzea sp. BCCO 10_0798]